MRGTSSVLRSRPDTFRVTLMRPGRTTLDGGGTPMLQNPVWQAFLATGFTWFMTALGAAMVFFFKTINKKALDLMLGFAAGVMTAASCWSLLLPSIEMCEASGLIKWLPPLVGFLLGGAFLFVADLLLPHMHPP